MKLTHYSNFLKWDSKIQNNGILPIAKINSIKFVDVYFKYPNTDQFVLDGINLTINEEEKLALVGLNGAGKSTLIKLLLRLYEPTKGKILINDIPIEEYELSNLRKQFGIIFQDFNRYNLTLREVVTISDLNNQNNDTDIIRACRNADIDIDDKTIFPQGLDTQIGKIFNKDGAELSGGQWQKLAIARAYFNQSSFMIFDEPNAALDPQSENRVIMNMKNLCNQKGCLLVTHRLSAVFFADKIAVINNGKVEEYGTHEELMSIDGQYKELFITQSSKYHF